jgi:phage/plasmid-associated DNA primase
MSVQLLSKRSFANVVAKAKEEKCPILFKNGTYNNKVYQLIEINDERISTKLSKMEILDKVNSLQICLFRKIDEDGVITEWSALLEDKEESSVLFE